MIDHSGVFVLVFSHFADALAADILAAEGNQIPEGAAKYAGWFKLLEDNPVIFHINFQFVPFGNVQGAAKLDGQDDSSQFIHFPDDAC